MGDHSLSIAFSNSNTNSTTTSKLPIKKQQIIALTPFEWADTILFKACHRQGLKACLDLGHDPQHALQALNEVHALKSIGVRCHTTSMWTLIFNNNLACDVQWIMADIKILKKLDHLDQRPPETVQVWAELYAIDDLIWAFTCPWIHAVVLCGQEAAGTYGEVGNYLWMQRYYHYNQKNTITKPFAIRGGVNVASASAALLMGADAIILDQHWSMCTSSRIPTHFKDYLSLLEGKDSVCFAGRRILSRPGSYAWQSIHTPSNHVSDTLSSQDQVISSHNFDFSKKIIPLSAHPPECQIFEGMRVTEAIHDYKSKIESHIQASISCFMPYTTINSTIKPLEASSFHGARLSIAQGPMTRVSDVAPFALAVAKAGGLPFIALSLMTPQKAQTLIQEVKALVGDLPWGIGILGFAPKALRQAHLDLIKQYKPNAALIAGGRPSQARSLEVVGIPTYLHVPSPHLLELFIQEGARRFVFEGSECGGHIGPQSSWTLWGSQIEVLQKNAHLLPEISCIWAGGIHDAFSACLNAVMTAPLRAQGAHMRYLMGTAYLFTHEAVSSGAILPEFQAVALACQNTVTLHTAPGHATRCAPSQYVEEFLEHKQQLQQQGLPSRKIWEELEKLNVGRLRMASKGITRTEEGLIRIDQKIQKKQGMYMIGEVASLRNQALSMSELHQQVADDSVKLLKNYLDSYTQDKYQDIEIPSISSPIPISQPAPVVYPSKVRLSDTIHKDTPIMQESDLPTDLNESNEISRSKKTASIAIIGIACLFPDANTHQDFWSHILESHDAIQEVPTERWSSDIYYDPTAPAGEKCAAKWGGFLGNIPFDPMRYGIPPQTMAAVEPVQLLALEVAYQALCDAGYDPLDSNAKRSIPRESTSVIFGAEAGTDLANAYSLRNNIPQWIGPLTPELDEYLPKLTEDSFAGVLANVIAGRIANRLDLGGVNYTVDAACASSLTAVDVAIKELRSGCSDVVLCGGADLHNSVNDYLMFSSVHALSKEGKCKTFDQSADGITLGEGIAVLVLKRLEDARQDEDRIYAVIEGVGASSDGKCLGLTAPRKEGQQRALMRAYQHAQVSPQIVGLVEAHGTGTIVGDRTELQALTEVYQEAGATVRSCGIGSVKSQIGHTKCAAGLAGLIKVALSVYHATLPPTLHIKNPNQAYDPQKSPFLFYQKPYPWLESQRWGAVSAFGFGGTNFHAVIRSETQDQRRIKRQNWPYEPFCLYGATPSQAQTLAQTFADALLQRKSHKTPAPYTLRDWGYSLLKLGQKQASQSELQAILLVTDWEDAYQQLLRFATEGQAQWVKSTENFYTRDQVALLFVGQGAQKVGMMQELFNTFPIMDDVLHSGLQWAKSIFPTPEQNRAEKKEQQARLTDTRNAQPALGLCDLALFKLLSSWGVDAQHLAGHSYGELVALTVAGAIAEKDLPHLSAARAESMLAGVQNTASHEIVTQSLELKDLANHIASETSSHFLEEIDTGSMAAISADSKIVVQHLAQINTIEGVVLANLNSPKQTVISGPTPAIERCVTYFKSQKISAKKIAVACAFHSPMLTKGAELFTQKVASIHTTTLSSRYQVWSNQYAQPYPSVSIDELALPQRLGQHIVNSVRFQEQIEAMYKAGVRVFVEVGPARIQSNLLKSILAEQEYHSIACAPRHGTLQELLEALAHYSILTDGVLWQECFAQREAKALSIDSLSQSYPARLLWWVNGQRAWPDRGKQPKHALKIPNKPLGYHHKSQASSKEKLVPHDQTQTNTNTNTNTNTLKNSFPSSPLQNLKKQSTSPTHSVNHVSHPNHKLFKETPVLLNTPQHQVKTSSTSHRIAPQTYGDSSPERSTVVPQNYTSGLHHSVHVYLENMRLLAQQQQQVMLSMMGQVNQDPVSAPVLLSQLNTPTSIPQDISPVHEWWGQNNTVASHNHSDYTAHHSMISSPSHDAQNSSVNISEKLQNEAIPSMDSSQSNHSLEIASPSHITHELVVQNIQQNHQTIINISEVLLNLVSERTGYPSDLLGLDLDLEADLSIDSIKRIEILGALGEQLGMQSDDPEVRDQMIEELALMKSLREMIAWLEQKHNKSEDHSLQSLTVDDPLEEGVLVSEISYPKAKREPVPRKILTNHSAPLPTTVVISDIHENNFYEHVLHQHNQALDADNILSYVDRIVKYSSSHIQADTHTYVSKDMNQHIHVVYSLDRSVCQQVSKSILQNFFEEIQILWKSSTFKTQKSAFTVIVPKAQNIEEIIDWGGLSGLLKTAQLENPNICIRLIECDQDLPLSMIQHESMHHYKYALHYHSNSSLTSNQNESHESSFNLESDLESDLDMTCELIRYDSNHQRLRTIYQNQTEEQLLASLEFNNETHTGECLTPIKDNSPILITGGARGITALCVRQLPLQNRDLILCGSTPFPNHEVESELWEKSKGKDEKSLRSLLITLNPKLDLKTCTQKASLLKRQHEIDEQLSYLRQKGARAHYVVVDLLDLTSDLSLFERIQQQLSAISIEQVRMVIHAAGIIDDQHLVDKTWDRFYRVYSIKARSLHALYYALPQVKTWIVFSSIAAARGNIGQIDYSTANATLDAFVSHFNHNQLEQKVVQACSIQWGPWKGTGMVSDSLLKFYEKQGIRFIQLSEGATAFAFESQYAFSNPSGIVCRSWPFI
jgi:acyl transferase domain-containing protein/NAD(P)H-dependent flavin oxidoreductase YrpB (nitropropane dioxygenase family)/NAD(P)-dependent dehydrogenase (short-subunit alcohol dehydrogenase family)